MKGRARLGLAVNVNASLKKESSTKAEGRQGLLARALLSTLKPDLVLTNCLPGLDSKSPCLSDTLYKACPRLSFHSCYFVQF